MTETSTPPRISSPLDKRCHLPVEQTKDQRRTTFFGAVRNEAGNPLSDERIPVVYGGEYVNEYEYTHSDDTFSVGEKHKRLTEKLYSLGYSLSRSGEYNILAQKV